LKFLDKFHTKPKFKQRVLSWDVDNLKNLAYGDKKDLNDENSKISSNFLSFLTLKGIQTKRIVSALIWCRNQSKIYFDGRNVDGNDEEMYMESNVSNPCSNTKEEIQYIPRLYGVCTLMTP
jgi:hypothetical protein